MILLHLWFSLSFPNIYGHIGMGGYLSVGSGEWSHNGALTYDRAETPWCGHNGGNGWILKTIVFNSSASNAVYGNSTIVQPESYRIHYIIKY